ncbi:benzoate 4-monooxygenase cytochrome P450 [Xylariomycetidae sp. FL0641]|nr:benzoate 4-monooxygenase cytochrome P450 [Xylariomycetidae sp. FL0641]
MSTTYHLTLLLACAAVAWVAWEYFFSSLRSIPGPFAAKFTKLWRVNRTINGHIDIDLYELHQKHGAAVRIAPNVVSLSDPSLIKTVYTVRNAWKKSEMYGPHDILVDGKRWSDIFNTTDEEWHAKMIKPIRSLYTMSRVQDVESYVDDTLRNLMDKLDTRYVETGKLCPMDKYMLYFSWDSAGHMTFGKEYDFLNEEKDVHNILETSEKGLDYFATVSQISWLDELLDKNPLYRLGPQPLVEGVKLAYQTVGAYMATQPPTSDPRPAAAAADTEHFMAKVMRLADRHEHVGFDQCVHYLLGNALAGGDSAGSAMASVVYHVGKTPSAAAKLAAELDAAALPLPAPYKRAAALPYLGAVVKEAQRLVPGVGLVMERVVPAGSSGMVLPDGRVLPPGTRVGHNPGVTNLDQGVFGENVTVYDPDRWLRREGEAEEGFERRVRRMNEVIDFNFGAGSRICLGRQIALFEIYKLFATLYSVYDIKFRDINHTWKRKNAWFSYMKDMPMEITRRRST